MARALGQDLRIVTNSDVTLLSTEGAIVRGGRTDIADCTVPNAQPQSIADLHPLVAKNDPGIMRSPNPVAIRLKRAREAAGYETAADFARAWQLNITTYNHHENGRRQINSAVAMQYAAILKLPAGTLLYGERLQSIAEIPIVGTIVADGKIQDMLANESIIKSVPMTDTDGLVGHIISGNDLYPVYRDSDVVFHQPLSSGRFSLEMLHGMECVCELADGQVLLRTISIQKDGLATLFAYHATPMFNQEIISASPVEVVQRHLPRQFHDS